MPLSDTDFQNLSQRLAGGGDALHRVEFTDEELEGLSREQATELAALHGARTLVRLPEREVAFFTWLRQNDPAVWNDLWGGAEEGDEEDPAHDDPYLVSLAYLPDLLPRGRGFLICDLEQEQNLWFGAESITREEGVGLLDASITLVHDSGRISLEQAFIVEVWRAPIDVWRFAWMYNRPLDEIKSLAAWLVSEGVLLLPETVEANAAREAEELRGESDDAGGVTMERGEGSGDVEIDGEETEGSNERRGENDE